MARYVALRAVQFDMHVRLAIDGYASTGEAWLVPFEATARFVSRAAHRLVRQIVKATFPFTNIGKRSRIPLQSPYSVAAAAGLKANEAAALRDETAEVVVL